MENIFAEQNGENFELQYNGMIFNFSLFANVTILLYTALRSHFFKHF